MEINSSNNTASRKRVLFVMADRSLFIENDINILRTKYDVEEHKINLKKTKNIISHIAFLLINIWRFDAVFVWFADYHSFFPVLLSRLFGKKSFVVVGGFDVARISSLNYGVFTSKIRSFCALWSMKHCTLNLSVSKFVDRKVRFIAPAAKTKVVYNGISINKPDKIISKEDTVLTVGIIDSERRFYIKGIDIFIETARRVPHVNFIIVGIDYKKLSHLLGNIPSNIKMHGILPNNQLSAYYSKAFVYCQLSQIETFCLALAEGMLHRCIPVVANVGGMPEVVGAGGFVVKRHPKEVSDAILKAFELKNDPGSGKLFEKRVRENFLLKKREMNLLGALYPFLN